MALNISVKPITFLSLLKPIGFQKTTEKANDKTYYET